ncbi:glutamyl-tRNA reductase [Caldilinea sp.]|uniref:glutamyl-tRNA reductase n=1 Tax=Caldilinea sp. TaxID=2293560 RepID=UPI002C73A275|nr:glutamyl-tRNA reductase [Caldilinea sp.]HRA66383.1 glutamyl-tRNA reductase [Caldilinea sp.]
MPSVKKQTPAILLVGLNHRTTPIAVREQLALGACKLPMVAEDLHAVGAPLGAVQEVVILSTCNRLEIYATSGAPAEGIRLIGEKLARQRNVPFADLAHYFYTKTDYQAIDHLMRVASGLDSLILGEAQILGQVATAFAAAQANGSSGPILSQLFSRALHCGKRARTETPIGSYTTSVSHAAVRLAEAGLGDLRNRRALIIGAGEMAELAATALQQHNVDSLIFINRTAARAEQLAMTFGARAVDWSRLDEALTTADLVISATGAPHVMLSAQQVAHAMHRRGGRPLLLIDIALPRDIDGAVDDLPGVTRYDIDHLRDSIDANLARREAAIPQVEAIITAEAEAVVGWCSGREVLPTVIELRRRAEAIARQEVERTLHRLLHQAPNHARIGHEVEQLADRIVAKLLHEPTVRLKAYAASGDGAAYAQTLGELFALASDAAPHAEENALSIVTPKPARQLCAQYPLVAYQNGAYSHE